MLVDRVGRVERRQPRVGEHVSQLAGLEARVDRDCDRAEEGAAEEELDECRVVRHEDAERVAAPDAERDELAGACRGALEQLGVRQARVREDERLRERVAARRLLDHVRESRRGADGGCSHALK
jgi:hypothetical protein